MPPQSTNDLLSGWSWCPFQVLGISLENFICGYVSVSLFPAHAVVCVCQRLNKIVYFRSKGMRVLDIVFFLRALGFGQTKVVLSQNDVSFRRMGSQPFRASRTTKLFPFLQSRQIYLRPRRKLWKDTPEDQKPILFPHFRKAHVLELLKRQL